MAVIIPFDSDTAVPYFSDLHKSMVNIMQVILFYCSDVLFPQMSSQVVVEKSGPLHPFELTGYS